MAFRPNPPFGSDFELGLTAPILGWELIFGWEPTLNRVKNYFTIGFLYHCELIPLWSLFVQKIQEWLPYLITLSWKKRPVWPWTVASTAESLTTAILKSLYCYQFIVNLFNNNTSIFSPYKQHALDLEIYTEGRYASIFFLSRSIY